MVLLLAVAGIAVPSEARHALGSGAQLRCLHAAETSLRCDDRLLEAAAVALGFELAKGRASPTRPVGLPLGRAHAKPAEEVVAVKVPKLAEVPTAIEEPVPSAAGAGAPRARDAPDASAAAPESGRSGADAVWLWYVLVPVTLLIVMAVFLLPALRMRQLERDDLISTGPSKASRALAFLESQDSDGKRHAVTSDAYRIGRHSDNDLTIRDPSVSRQHAEIHRRRNGSFTITDLDSMNGVFVNQKKIDSVTLSDGDIIEIGDTSFRFRTKEQVEPSDGETLAQHDIDTVVRRPNAKGR